MRRLWAAALLMFAWVVDVSAQSCTAPAVATTCYTGGRGGGVPGSGTCVTTEMERSACKAYYDPLYPSYNTGGYTTRCRMPGDAGYSSANVVEYEYGLENGSQWYGSLTTYSPSKETRCVAPPVACPADGTVLSSNSTTRYSIPGTGSTACLNGCLGVPEWMYGTGANRWAVGPWTSMGVSCTPGGSTTPTATEQTPQQNSCPAGTCPGTAFGNSLCVPCSVSNNDVMPPTAASAPQPGASSPGTITTTVNPDGTVTTTTRNPDGTSSSSTSPGNQIGLEGYCLRNPTAFICTGTPGGSSSAASAPSGAASGAGGSLPPSTVTASSSSLRTPGTRTVLQAMTDVRNGLGGTPLGSAAGSFFTVSASGSCPTWVLNLAPVLSTSITVDFMCSSAAQTVLAALRVCLLLMATWFAWRVMVE